MPCRSRTRPRPHDRSGRESGQIALGALLILAPCLVLILSLLNVSLVTRARVKRQLAADAAALATAGATARALNIISVNNTLMTYFVSEIIAEEALFNTTPRLISEARALAVAAAAIPFVGAALSIAYEWEAVALENLDIATRSLYAINCQEPFGIYLIYSKTLMSVNKALVESSFFNELNCGEHMATLNGARLDRGEFALRHFDHKLQASEGSKRDLLIVASVGSPSYLPRSFRRGYTPILGLPLNRGPADVIREKYYDRIFWITFLVGGAWQYNMEHRKLLFQKIASPGTSYPKAMLLEKLSINPDLKRYTTAWDIRNFRTRHTRTVSVTTPPEALIGGDGTRWGTGFQYSYEPRRSYASAEVYNGTSWDTFTEDWRVRLVPNTTLSGTIEWNVYLPAGLREWLVTH